MDTLLEYLYVDVMHRCWSGSPRQTEAVKEWKKAEGKDWEDIYNAAQLLAEEQSMTAFLAGFHLGCCLENDLWQQLGPLF